MASERSRGLPIFHDDMTFHDRHERAFQEMQRRFEEDFGRRDFGRSFYDPWNWRDDLDKLCTDFYKLKPASRLGGAGLDEFGSRDSLDDLAASSTSTSTKNMYVEHPQTKSRTFHMSFDVRDYNPGDITVKTDGDELIITARHEEEVGGHKNVREFSRRIRIPADVDPEKLTSTLSHDGILTVHAPVPPKYTSVAYVNPASSTSAAATAARTHAYQKQQPPTAPPPAGDRGGQTAEVSRAQPSAQQTQQAPNHAAPPTAGAAAAAAAAAGPGPHQQTAPPPSAGVARTSEAAPHGDDKSASSREPPPLFEHTSLADLPLDAPTFVDSADGGREFQLAIEVPRPFTPDDVVVRLDGRTLNVEATHEERSQGKTSTSSMNRNFELTEDLDPASVEAMLRSDGCLLIKGKVKRNT